MTFTKFRIRIHLPCGLGKVVGWLQNKLAFYK